MDRDDIHAVSVLPVSDQWRIINYYNLSASA
jgi:hypothetical protein